MKRIKEISTVCTDLTKAVSDSFDGVLDTTREMLMAAAGLEGISKDLKRNVSMEFELNE